MKTKLFVIALMFVALTSKAFASSSHQFDESAIRLANILARCPGELAAVMAGESFIRLAISVSPRPDDSALDISVTRAC